MGGKLGENKEGSFPYYTATAAFLPPFLALSKENARETGGRTER